MFGIVWASAVRTVGTLGGVQSHRAAAFAECGGSIGPTELINA